MAFALTITHDQAKLLSGGSHVMFNVSSEKVVNMYTQLFPSYNLKQNLT